MGKINLDSLKSCIENAKDSFNKMEANRPAKIRSINSGSSGDIDAMMNSTRALMDNIHTFARTGS